MERRVVITGMGAITPIGNSVQEFWEGLEQGKCGIDNITLIDVSQSKVKLGAEIKNLNLLDYFTAKELKSYDRFSMLAIIAERELMKNSGLDIEKIDNTRFGVAIASGIGGLQTIEDNKKIQLEKGFDKVSPRYIPAAISNMATGNIAIEVKAKGESFCMSTACASATHTIGECFRIIKHGYQDLMITGGTEAAITATGMSGFVNIKAVTTTQDKTRASIPFDKERHGFVMGEGSGLILLEELEHAKKRGAKIYAEVVGFGSTSDAFHITAPSPEGEGGARAMINAIKDANITPEQIDYINAHGTSTPLNDKCETKAIKKALGEHSKKVMISSIKGNIGHLLGAAGGVEAIACIKAINEGKVPPTIGYKVFDEECDLDVVPNIMRNANVTYAMSNSLGFGGHNSTIIFKKYED